LYTGRLVQLEEASVGCGPSSLYQMLQPTHQRPVYCFTSTDVEVVRRRS